MSLRKLWNASFKNINKTNLKMVSAADVFQCLKYLNIVVFVYLFSKLSADDADHITGINITQSGHDSTDSIAETSAPRSINNTPTSIDSILAT